MESTNAMRTANSTDRKAASSFDKRGGILYPAMLIVAIVVIILSVLGIATMMGYIPGALSKIGPDAGSAPAAGSETAKKSGDSRLIAAGVGAGAYAGHAIERDIIHDSASLRAQVGMGDGTHRAFSERLQPAFAAGQKRA